MGGILRLKSVRAVVLPPLLALTVVSYGTPAHADGLYSGACTMTLTTSASSGAPLLPAPTTVWFSGGGTCVVNATVVPMSFSGLLATTSITGGWSCAAGVATGTGVFDVSMVGFPDPLVQLVVVNTGASLELAAYALNIRFDGGGVLAGEPLDAATCALGGGPATRTWTGAFAFQDPETPVG